MPVEEEVTNPLKQESHRRTITGVDFSKLATLVVRSSLVAVLVSSQMVLHDRNWFSSGRTHVTDHCYFHYCHVATKRRRPQSIRGCLTPVPACGNS